jgi:hypothetical protein
VSYFQPGDTLLQNCAWHLLRVRLETAVTSSQPPEAVAVEGSQDDDPSCISLPRRSVALSGALLAIFILLGAIPITLVGAFYAVVPLRDPFVAGVEAQAVFAFAMNPIGMGVCCVVVTLIAGACLSIEHSMLTALICGVLCVIFQIGTMVVAQSLQL